MTTILVVDNDGQFTHLEARALRDVGVETEVVENTTPPADLDADGLVLSGGPDDATGTDAGGRCAEYLDLDVPILGICLGMQLMATALGGSVESGEYGGYADVTVEITEPDDPVVGSLAPETGTWASHADEVVAVPDGFTRTARSEVCGVEAMSDPSRECYGVQWHPEVSHTEAGTEVFENFRTVCEE